VRGPPYRRPNQAVRANIKCVFILTASRAGGFAGTIKLGKRTKSGQRQSPSGWPTGFTRNAVGLLAPQRFGHRPRRIVQFGQNSGQPPLRRGRL
jgi:hypothetical protein